MPNRPRRKPTFVDVVEADFSQLAKAVKNLFVDNRNFSTGYYFDTEPLAHNYIRRVLADQGACIIDKLDDIEQTFRELSSSMLEEAMNLCWKTNHVLDQAEVTLKRAQSERLFERVRDVLTRNFVEYPSLAGRDLPPKLLTREFVSDYLPQLTQQALDSILTARDNALSSVAHQLQALDEIDTLEPATEPMIVSAFSGAMGPAHAFVAYTAADWHIEGDRDSSVIANIFNMRINALSAIAFARMSTGVNPSTALTDVRDAFKNTLSIYLGDDADNKNTLRTAAAALASIFGREMVSFALATAKSKHHP